jgi:hypothetical protein
MEFKQAYTAVHVMETAEDFGRADAPLVSLAPDQDHSQTMLNLTTLRTTMMAPFGRESSTIPPPNGEGTLISRALFCLNGSRVFQDSTGSRLLRASAR